MITTLILTALEEKERQIVLSYLTNPTTERHPVTGTDYYVSIQNLNNKPQKIVLGRTDQTNTNSGIETERAIAHFKPDFIFFIGVAGGLKDVKVGDIVIGQDVFGYERGKTDLIKEGENQVSIFKPRPKFGFSSYSMERMATNLAFSNDWKNLAEKNVNTQFHDVIKVYTGTIASGEKVNADVRSELHKFLSINCSHALAIEMEGLGFLESCRAYPHIQTLLIRGISDLIKAKSEEDEKGSQEYATKNAADFLFLLLNKIAEEQNNKIPTHNVILLDVLCKLYPEGVRDNNIFQRAGGDLAKIKLNSTGFNQWFQTIELISNGGSISFDKLYQIMKEDYANNEFVKAL